MNVETPVRPEGPSERFVPCAVYPMASMSGYPGSMWRVLDRQSGGFVNTLPRRFHARESARLCALNLNRGSLHVRQVQA